jgi:hypothetical protein
LPTIRQLRQRRKSYSLILKAQLQLKYLLPISFNVLLLSTQCISAHCTAHSIVCHLGYGK